MALRGRRREGDAVALTAEYSPQIERRRDAACLVAVDDAVVARIATAPAAYVLAHTSSDIARHCQLLSTLPAPGEVRVTATPGRAPDEWRIDVATRDAPGLLASFAGALAAGDLDVLQAVVATWRDGGALDAFVVRAPVAPEPVGLRSALEASLGAAPSAAPLPDAVVEFDHTASSLYSACEVRALDRPGLLSSLAVAFTTAGAAVQAASVTTVGGVAVDRFDLSDAAGRKVDAGLELAIRRLVASGVSVSRGARAGPMTSVPA